jgi:hypothetical protein
MNGKAVTRARKARAATRTGKKTASAPEPMQAAPKPATTKASVKKPAALTPFGRKPAPARRLTAGRPEITTHRDMDEDAERDARLGVGRKGTGALHVEDDDDLDWLTEDEDPRKQIVEGDEEPDAHHDEW